MRSRNNPALCRMCLLVLCLAVPCMLFAQKDAQKDKSASKPDLSGHYEGSAKNAAGEVIDVKLDLTEKEGTMSGMIRSSHGDFTITGGHHNGEDVTLEFDAGGPAGTITLKLADDKLTGNWSAGDDGGPVDVKKVAAPSGDSKGKS